MHTYSKKLILCRLLLLPAAQYVHPKLLRSNMLLQASTPKAAVFQVFNLAAVFHISKPSFQQSFRYPNPASSSPEDVPQVRQIINLELCYTRNTHYDSVVALDWWRPMFWNSFSTNKCSWNRHNSNVKWLCCMTYMMRLFLLTFMHRIS